MTGFIYFPIFCCTGGSHNVLVWFHTSSQTQILHSLQTHTDMSVIVASKK